MIYLIETDYYDKEKGISVSLLKIGYTSDLSKRMSQYKTHNPLVKLLDIRDGDEELEEELQTYFWDYLYPGQTEWFYYNDEIIQGFKTDIDDYGRWPYTCYPDFTTKEEIDKYIKKKEETTKHFLKKYSNISDKEMKNVELEMFELNAKIYSYKCTGQAGNYIVVRNKIPVFDKKRPVAERKYLENVLENKHSVSTRSSGDNDEVGEGE